MTHTSFYQLSSQKVWKNQKGHRSKTGSRKGDLIFLSETRAPTERKYLSKVINPLSRTWCVGNLMRMFSAFNYSPKSQSPSRIKSCVQESSDVTTSLTTASFIPPSHSTNQQGLSGTCYCFCLPNAITAQIKFNWSPRRAWRRSVTTSLVICSQI